MAADEFAMTFGPDEPPKSEFEEEVASGDMRRALVAMRDLLAHELSGNRCKTCRMSQMRTGDLAALALRLQKVLEDLKQLPPEGEEVSPLDQIRNRRSGGVSEA